MGDLPSDLRQLPVGFFSGGANLTENDKLDKIVRDLRTPIPESFSNATRPSPASVAVGTMIFNTDDNAPNFSDGTNWRDAVGTIT